MGQEDGRFAALAADPFERRFWTPSGPLAPADWRALVFDALTSPHTWGPGVEPTEELERLADSTGPAPGEPHALDGFEDATLVLNGALKGCDAWIWKPDGPLSDLLVRDRWDVGPAFAAAADPAAAAGAWQALRATMRTDAAAADDFPWWLRLTMVGSWDVGVTSPAALQALVASLTGTGAIAAVAAWPPASGPERYAADLHGLLAFLERAAADGRWLLGTAAGT